MAEEHYLGNPLLKKANTQIEFTEEQIIEFAKCANDPVYFANNYIQIVTLDHGLQPFDMYPFQEKMLKSFHENRFNICKLPRQSGKALCLKTPIPTPKGWTTMGEIEIGDQIFSSDGDVVSVTMKTETMYNHDCYKLYFDNGDKVISDADHLWKVNSSYWTAGEKVLTAKEIYKNYQLKQNNSRGLGVKGSYYINASQPLEIDEDDLDLDPYLLGLWLGDGYKSDGRIVSHKDDYKLYKENIDVEYEREDGNCIRFKCRNLYKKLKDNNLLKNKHIPQKYLRSSHHNRLELLRGLMDTDGSVKPNTRSFEFYQKSLDFCIQVSELLSTLGIKSRIRAKKIKGDLYHTLSFTTTEIPFKLPRKVNLILNSRPTRVQDKRHYIQKIEKVDSVPVACISVDSKDKMFLCGKSFIPTHNSTTVVSYLLHYAIFNDNVNIAILANKAQTARDLLGRLQTGYENLPKWLQQGICSWNKGSLELENGSKIFAASTSASSVRGSTYNIIFLDEFAFVPNQVADSFFSSVYPTITSGKSSKVIVVSCVTKDTYLLTDKGYRKIETLINPNKEGAYFTDTYTVRGNSKFYSSDVIVNNKKSPTNIIKTRYEEIECSLDHKLWAYKNGKYEYVKSKDLSVGDYIALKYNQQIFGNDDYVGFNPEKGKSKNLFSCDYINEDIAYFIGLYVAEGYARNIINKDTGIHRGGQIIISCGDDISSALDKLNLPYSKTDDVHYTINSKQLVEFIRLLGFDINKKSTEKILSDKVLSWSKKNIVSLLRGMFDGDGCINKKGRVTYTSTSRELIRQVQLLLTNLGIIGSIYKTTSKPTELVKVYSKHYTIEITGSYAIKYFDEIGFGLPRKQERISFPKHSSRNGNTIDIIPGSSLIIKQNKNKDIRKLKLKSGRGKHFKSYSRQFLLTKRQSLYENSNETLREFLDNNVQEDMIWLKIKDIEQSYNEVFDVSLPDIEGDKWAHSVLYNNFLGHQTPKGLNHFYKLWDDAVKGKNEYVPIEVFWTDVPGRDEEFKKTTIANTSESQWRQEFQSVSTETQIEIEEAGIRKKMTIGDLYDELNA